MKTYRLHGYGSSGAEFRAIWQAVGQDHSAIYLDAIESDPLTGRRRWFPLSGSDRTIANHVARVAGYVEEQIGAELNSGESIDLDGHSQGGMIALELACRGRLPVRRVTCFAAFLPYITERHFRWLGTCSEIIFLSSFHDKFIDRSDVLETVQTLHYLGAPLIVDRLLSKNSHTFGKTWFSTLPLWEKRYVAA